jgi:3-oxoacyl-(acyl-carrier-protein) synthase
MEESVRVAGMGAVSCYGRGVEPLVAALQEGRQGTTLRKVGGTAGHDHYPVNAVPAELLGEGSAGLVSLLGLTIEDALRDAGRDPADALGKCGLLVGCANANYLGEAQWRRVRAAGEDAAPPDSHALLCELADRYGLQGPVTSLHTACSSSAVALLLARERILRGE